MTPDSEFARLEQLLAGSRAKTSAAARKYPVTRMAPHAAGTTLSTPANAGAIIPPSTKPAEAGTQSEEWT
jgi:hypothetical protein